MKPLILVANDDSIFSKGIKELVNIMKEIGEVWVVAPDTPQSGMGHAITLGFPLRINKSMEFGEDVPAYKCSGTPADCVKFGKHYLLKGRKIDLVVSGINHGANTAISILYSGTMSAAIEAATESIPAIGFSLCDYHFDADFSHCRDHIKNITLNVLNNDFPVGTTLNVNIPGKKDEPIQGIKITKQARGLYREFFEERKDPYNQPYFWMDGELVNFEKGQDTDLEAIEHNYISIVPVKFDLTDYTFLEKLKKWDL